MNQGISFSYSYSAKENREVQEIRKKYLPQSENKLEELRRLDRLVQASGMAEALSIGIGGFLVLGLGICLVIQVIGSGMAAMIFGVLFGIVGIIGMVAAYPVYRTVFGKTKAKFAPRILELIGELSGEKISTL